MKRIVVTAMLLFTGIFLLSECRGGTQNAITVYTALENEQVDRYLRSFKEKYPAIEVNIVRASTGVITARLLAEGENSPADLVWGTAVTSLLVLEEKGMIEPYAPAGIENILPEFKDTANPPAWVGLNAWEAAFMVNTVEAAAKNLPEITSYQDLLRPEFAGHIIMSNPSTSGTGFLFVAGLIQLMGQEAAFDYLDRLHTNIAMYTQSGSAPAVRAGTGEIAVGISYGYAGVAQIRKGFPVKLVFPSEGSGWDVEGNALIKKAAVKANARLFLDWAISTEAMNDIKDDYAIVSSSTAEVVIPQGYTRNPITQLIPNDLRWAAQNRDTILEEWMRRYEGKTEVK